MQGLVIWAHSYCRSTLAFFRALGNSFGVSLKLCVWKTNAQLRTKVGFTEDEFNDMDITFIGDNYKLALSILEKYMHYQHIFGAYQSVPIYQKIILDAHQKGCRIGICSEAPCNMTDGYKRIFKDIYIKYILPQKVKQQIKASDFIINLSGDDATSLEKLGWPKDKIIPCGYYSPRIEGTKAVKRTSSNWNNFTILLTGIHQWHRSPILLIKALVELKKEGLTPKCMITQDGPLLPLMKQIVAEHHLNNVEFLGFVEMSLLKKLYETCSVYIGSGNYEPWGMRLNDVLQCGAPLIVNKGMGGYVMVDKYKCGLTFNRDDHHGLAEAIKTMMMNEDTYLQVASNAIAAVDKISPEYMGDEIAKKIHKLFNGW